MGSIFACKCIDCAETFRISQGGGFVFTHRVCDTCAKIVSIPRYAPRPSRLPLKIPKLLQRRTNKFWLGPFKITLPFSRRLDRDREAIPYSKIQRFADDELRQIMDDRKLWGKSGDHWDPYEEEKLLEIAGSCSCGGKWVDPTAPEYVRQDDRNGPHLLHRCPHCRSSRFSYDNEASFD